MPGGAPPRPPRGVHLRLPRNTNRRRPPPVHRLYAVGWRGSNRLRPSPRTARAAAEDRCGTAAIGHCGDRALRGSGTAGIGCRGDRVPRGSGAAGLRPHGARHARHRWNRHAARSTPSGGGWAITRRTGRARLLDEPALTLHNADGVFVADVGGERAAAADDVATTCAPRVDDAGTTPGPRRLSAATTLGRRWDGAGSALGPRVNDAGTALGRRSGGGAGVANCSPGSAGTRRAHRNADPHSAARAGTRGRRRGPARCRRHGELDG